MDGERINNKINTCDALRLIKLLSLSADIYDFLKKKQKKTIK
jgi:hypothetical protein